MGKKQVIAYLHTHWDREWYREHEVFRLRLLKVFDNVLEMLQKGQIPCFYFDGQVSAINDYLELNPDKKGIIKYLIRAKKLFIGPFYCLIDEFLTDRTCFEKNLEIGLKAAQELGCEDFIGYLPDTFGHSQNVPKILKKFGIDKCMVWRGCPDNLYSEFLWDGIKTINLSRGYFHDVFTGNFSMQEQIDYLNKNLNLINNKSSDILLLPLGGDHLGINENIAKEIENINPYLDDFKIKLGSPFEYFEFVDFKQKYQGELRNNSETFILQGCYSSRMDLKKMNAEASHKLHLTDKFQKYCNEHYNTKSYDNVVEYVYKLLLENQAHDAICGCSLDAVHKENKLKYENIIKIADGIIDELKFEIKEDFIINLSEIEPDSIQFESKNKHVDCQLIDKKTYVENEIMSDIMRVPITEDFKQIYTYLKEIKENNDKIKITQNSIENSYLKFEIIDKKINILDKINNKTYKNCLEIVNFKDLGDSYNFAPDKKDNGEIAKIMSSKIKIDRELKSTLEVKLKLNKIDINLNVSLLKNSKYLDFAVKINNKKSNHILQMKFNTKNAIKMTISEDMNELIKREFEADYEIREHLPSTKGIEAKTNTAPLQRFVHANDFNLTTKGLREYEIKGNAILITLIRATGIISNPKNVARTTPAGPPIETPDLQMQNENIFELSLNFEGLNFYKNCINHSYPEYICKIN